MSINLLKKRRFLLSQDNYALTSERKFLLYLLSQPSVYNNYLIPSFSSNSVKDPFQLFPIFSDQRSFPQSKLMRTPNSLAEA